MKYAVIKIGGKQYKVSEGDEILVDRLDVKVGDDYFFQEVLLIKDSERLEVGNPCLEGARVLGKVVEHLKGRKMTVAKFKAKVRYRRKIGFRPLYTKIRIESISIGSTKEKPAEKRAKTKKLK